MTLMELLRSPDTKRPVIGGHRGHQSEIRENTVRNFRQLLGKGIPYVEIDVQLTRDGELVLFHDAFLEASTGLPGTVGEYTLEQLRDVFEIDTVEDTVRWCRDNGMGIAFELKPHTLRTPEVSEMITSKLSALIGKFGFYDNCFVFSKNYAALARIRELDPGIPLGIIPPKDPEEGMKLMQQLGAVIWLDYLEGFSKTLVDKLHAAGYLADGSVVNTPERLAEAKNLGVDMIESDDPISLLYSE